MKCESAQLRDIYIGRLDYGCDLLEGLTGICIAKGVTLGWIQAIGAVQACRVGFYNQETRAYEYVCVDRPMEMAQLTGNVSLKDGRPFIHAHVTLMDDEGQAHGGHLAPGTIVFACEFMIEHLAGPTFERTPDDATGLPLWSGD
jgi:predicted DNA-binding protein with PD1-like motif